jgi:hypothetical protein
MLLAWLVFALHGPGAASRDVAEPVQLLFIAPQRPPTIRLESPQPTRLRSGVPVSPLPPLITGTASPTSEASLKSGPVDGGAGIDWAAEKRRALQAFEIRSRQPAANNSVSRASPAEQPWWPAHRPGDRYKTADGNWIVWIDSSCYQVATSSPSTNGSGQEPQTVCPDGSGRRTPERTDPVQH